MEKNCVECGETYTVRNNQWTRSKYCSQRCKWRVQARRCKKTKNKGGYNRVTYIRLWLTAMGIEERDVPCHYCEKPLSLDSFTIDHKVPRVMIDQSERKANNEIENLVVSCSSCNALKGASDYHEFKESVTKWKGNHEKIN